MIFYKNQRLGEISVKSKENKEIKENYQMHAICVVYTYFFYVNALSMRFINEEEEEMCTNFQILLGIKNLRTCQKKVWK